MEKELKEIKQKLLQQKINYIMNILNKIYKILNIKKLLDIRWCVQFDNKKDAEIYCDKLKKIFEPLSTKQKTEYDKDVGHIAQYSTRNQNDKGIRDVAFCFGKSLQTKKYEITLSLMNEFVND